VNAVGPATADRSFVTAETLVRDVAIAEATNR